VSGILRWCCDAYLREPLNLVALRHDIAETLERLARLTSAKGQ
jgi:hypothetical protein